jgi:hypothetical protein
MFIFLLVELVDNALKVIGNSIGIIAFYGCIIEFVDLIFVIFGKMLDLRFKTMTYNTVIQACKIR